MNILFHKKTLLIGLFCFVLCLFPAQASSQNTDMTVDLIWEAVESYTPPFYEGKALHPGWGPVRVSTIAHIYQDGDRVERDSLVYTWKYNGLVYGDDSGRGESSFTINTVPRNGNQVTVEVKTADGEIVMNRSIILPITEPELLFYQQDPLLGTRLQESLEREHVLENSDEITLEAQPYFFLTNQQDESLSYNWQMNRSSITPTEQESSVTLRRQSGAEGRADVSLELEDTNRLFPTARSSIQIIF